MPSVGSRQTSRMPCLWVWPSSGRVARQRASRVSIRQSRQAADTWFQLLEIAKVIDILTSHSYRVASSVIPDGSRELLPSSHIDFSSWYKMIVNWAVKKYEDDHPPHLFESDPRTYVKVVELRALITEGKYHSVNRLLIRMHQLELIIRQCPVTPGAYIKEEYTVYKQVCKNKVELPMRFQLPDPRDKVSKRKFDDFLSYAKLFLHRLADWNLGRKPHKIEPYMIGKEPFEIAEEALRRYDRLVREADREEEEHEANVEAEEVTRVSTPSASSSGLSDPALKGSFRADENFERTNSASFSANREPETPNSRKTRNVPQPDNRFCDVYPGEENQYLTPARPSPKCTRGSILGAPKESLQMSIVPQACSQQPACLQQQQQQQQQQTHMSMQTPQGKQQQSPPSPQLLVVPVLHMQQVPPMPQFHLAYWQVWGITDDRKWLAEDARRN